MENHKLLELIEETMNQLVEQQKKELLKCGRRVIPHLTADDMLQPNDFNELEQSPHFRFEEGVLIGIQTTQMAFLALVKEHFSISQN